MHLFIIKCWNHHRFCPIIINNLIGWHNKIQWHFIGIVYLALEGSNYSLLRSNRILIDVCWLFLAKWSSYTKRGYAPLHHVRPSTCAGLETAVCDLASCHAVYFIVSSNWHSSSSVQAGSQQFLFWFLEMSLLWANEGHLGGVRVYHLLLLSLQLWTFASATMTFLPALQLFVFAS